MLLAVSLLYLLASIPAVADLASRCFSSDAFHSQRRTFPPGRTAIVVLGSGGVTARDWDANAYSIVDPWAASRVLEASRVFRAIDRGLGHQLRRARPSRRSRRAER